MGRCPRGERAGGEGDILILFTHCHPERSEGSHCPTTSKHKKRYLATRALVLIVPNHTGALLGMTGGGEEAARTSLGRACHFGQAKRRFRHERKQFLMNANKMRNRRRSRSGEISRAAFQIHFLPLREACAALRAPSEKHVANR